MFSWQLDCFIWFCCQTFEDCACFFLYFFILGVICLFHQWRTGICWRKSSLEAHLSTLSTFLTQQSSCNNIVYFWWHNLTKKKKYLICFVFLTLSCNSNQTTDTFLLSEQPLNKSVESIYNTITYIIIGDTCFTF